ncbi:MULTISPECIES: hypothetical protein [Lelliottia]|uniref:Restriction alleviation protein, Lar family n=1 Tax=Lelliottia aquatilis TaxID=2080838 RepID=A0ABX5A4L7_9ENTR|nr:MULTISPECIES: hypothetical protein [Lelliottia]POZ14093.1 hypothetical protein C3Z09_20160 [Lelliottia aquatilis]POZ23995.1 hypothetical protein C3712_07165 [Lelliottia aquatilis]POZ27603.1 hypothetical protein C3708_08490 [Lelliottia sp. 7254-16]POZ29872.1 hypothetical protein C3711_01700 [Lelliottia aquatilis]POZ35437.1 hypothetical protein C3710_01700 [Lelliottia aquatilis]
MQRIELPECPTCGNTVELFCKETRWAGTAQIRCVGHHHIGMGYSPGGEQGARAELFRRWQELTELETQGKNNG